MGMFDSVMVPCPKCGELIEAQSKSGDCMLRCYDFPNEGATNPAPHNVMLDVNRHSPHTCVCGTVFNIMLVKEPIIVPGEYAVVEIKKDNDEDTEQLII